MIDVSINGRTFNTNNLDAKRSGYHSIVYGTAVATPGSIYTWEFCITQYYYPKSLYHLFFGVMKQNVNDTAANVKMQETYKLGHHLCVEQITGDDVSRALVWDGKKSKSVQSRLKSSGTNNQTVAMTLDMKTNQKVATLVYTINGVAANDATIQVDVCNYVLACGVWFKSNEVELVKFNVA